VKEVHINVVGRECSVDQVFKHFIIVHFSDSISLGHPVHFRAKILGPLESGQMMGGSATRMPIISVNYDP
jgi:hypothetical protein